MNYIIVINVGYFYHYKHSLTIPIDWLNFEISIIILEVGNYIIYVNINHCVYDHIHQYGNK